MIASNNINFDLEKVLVIIPVLNEEAAIATVIHSLQAQGLRNIRIIDNGSTDNSIAEATAAGAEVVLEPTRGYGQACWRGLQALPTEIEWILFCDGDGSDDLSQLPQFFAIAPQADLILGNRRATTEGRAALTPTQNFGNWLATRLLGWGWGHWYHDLGPLRLIRYSALEQMQMGDRSFGWTVEMQARAIDLDLKICELPVGYRRRQGGHSKISGTLRGSLRAGQVILSTLGILYWQRLTQRGQHPFLWLSGIFLILGALLALPYGNFQQLGMVPRFWLGIGIMGLGFVTSWTLRSVNFYWFWGLALLPRLILIPMEPSDDVWRYLWEGYIQNFGFSPYELAPNAPELIPYRTEWWGLMNHPDTTAIYPPLAQLGFRILASVSPAVWLFKLAFTSADLGVCWLLSRRWGYLKTLLYAWNPVIIYSFAGGAHYDSWFILPLVGAWLALESRQSLRSALLLGISVAIKWISLPFLGLLLLRSRLKQLVWILLSFLAPVLLSFPLFCHGDQCSLIPTQSVFVTHGRSAEFFPYLLSLIWLPSTNFNWIYALPLCAVILALLRYCRQFAEFAEWYFFALLTLSPNVHAWYFTWLVPFSVPTQNLGTRWVSLSSFIYFVLKHRQALGNSDWKLTPLERYWLWLPLVIGFLWTYRRILLSSTAVNTRDSEIQSRV